MRKGMLLTGSFPGWSGDLALAIERQSSLQRAGLKRGKTNHIDQPTILVAYKLNFGRLAGAQTGKRFVLVGHAQAKIFIID